MLLTRAKVLLSEFATLILFWAVYWPFGIKAAIAATVVYVIVDAVRRHWQGVPFGRLYILSSAMAIGFGAIDLLSKTPFMIKYEAVITNIVIGAIFTVGARGERPIFQNVAEDWTGEAFPKRPDIRRFFALFTLMWAAYFFVKAVVYFWIGETMPMEQALGIRALIGTPSLIAMVALSTQGRHLHTFCRYMGWLPAVEAAVAAPASEPASGG